MRDALSAQSMLFEILLNYTKNHSEISVFPFINLVRPNLALKSDAPSTIRWLRDSI